MSGCFNMCTARNILTAVHELPVVEHGLGEGLSLCLATKIGGETEGLGDGEVSLDGEHGRL